MGQTVNYAWYHNKIKNRRDAFIKGLTTGLKSPTQRGPRFVIVHAGYEGGFLPGAARFFGK